VLVIVVAMAAGGGGDDDDTASIAVPDSVIEDVTTIEDTPTTDEDSSGTASLEDAKLTSSDLPSGFTEEPDEFKALPIAACAGAVESPTSTLDEKLVTSFTKGSDGPAVTQTIFRYDSGAEAEYSLLARSIADCRSQAGDSDSPVIEASAIDLGDIGDERTGARVLLGRRGNPHDPPFVLDMATVRVGDTTMTITASGPEGSVESGLVADLITTAARRLD
jgi:hypothetical protein